MKVYWIEFVTLAVGMAGQLAQAEPGTVRKNIFPKNMNRI
jgi:hypothetical protein